MPQIELGPLGILIARLTVAGFFILAGLNKIINYQATVMRMEDIGLWGELLPLTILLECVGGLILFIGRGKSLYLLACLALALFTLTTNFFFHRFWELNAPLRQLELSLFFKNLVMSGALIMLMGLQLQSLKRAD